MQSNYSIVSEKNEVFHVKEIPTDQIIRTYSTRKEANKFFKRAKSGGYFNGWTPTFMLRKADIKFKTNV